MSSLTYVFVTPLGIVNTLRLRCAYLLPGVIGTLAGYAYYPRPTNPLEGWQNMTGTRPPPRDCAFTHHPFRLGCRWADHRRPGGWDVAALCHNGVVGP